MRLIPVPRPRARRTLNGKQVAASGSGKAVTLRRALLLFAASAVLAGGTGCSFAMRSVRFEATPADWEMLSGDWRGEYTVPGRERHGLIEFRLKGLLQEAAGEVLMFTEHSGWPITGMPPSDQAGRRPPRDAQLLVIHFVTADRGMIRGTMNAYWDPDRECLANASFLGSVDGDVIAGSFVSTCEDGVRVLRGRWRVERRRAAETAPRDPTG